MIIANLATYPPRRESLPRIIRSLSSQVDLLNIVLNEYVERPNLDHLPVNVRLLLPPRDLKDTAKFYPAANPDDVVFFVDDDIIYPCAYVQQTVTWLQSLPNDRFVVGYHGSIYHRFYSRAAKPLFKQMRARLSGLDPIALNRKVRYFAQKLEKPIVVDQLGTGAVAMWGRHVPPFDYMASSQKFVDVRFARWSFDRDLTLLCLPRFEGWLQPVNNEETIYRTFTQSWPMHVTNEIRAFALKRKNVGSTLDLANCKATNMSQRRVSSALVNS